MAHALLSASGAKRWMACPPSARLESNVADEQSPYAAEGTKAHDLAERKLLHIYQNGKGVRKTQSIDEEMWENVNKYVETVQEHYNTINTDGPALISVEERVDFSHIVPEGFGTADAIIIGNGVIEVMDLKYGKGVPIDAKDNPQIRLYALGALAAYDFMYDFNTVRMTIVQPRLNSITTDEMPVKDLKAWAETVKPKAEMAFKGEGDMVAGDHCQFCKVRHTCRKLSEYCLELVDEHSEKPPAELYDVEVSAILDRYCIIKRWLEDVHAYAEAEALQGRVWPGYKLVEGTSRRKIVNVAEAIKRLNEAGYEPSDYYKPAELQGITNLQKLLGPKGLSDILGDVIEKPPGKPTLVTIDDKREPIELDTVKASDFDL